MCRNGLSHLNMLWDTGTEACGDVRPSEKVQLAFPSEVPVFVRRAIALGYDEAETWALWRQIAKTGRDVRARKITPAGGLRRAERMALAVAVVKVAGVSP